MGLVGCLFILIIAWLCSASRSTIKLKPILAGLGIQLVIGVLLLKTPVGEWMFKLVNGTVDMLMKSSNEGAALIFGSGFREHFFAFSVLSAVVFFSSLTSVLFYCGILQFLIGGIAHFVRKAFSISGAEALAAAANVFVGQIEAPMFIKGSISSLSRSQLFTVMVCGMATIAGSLMAVYAGMGISAGHLLTATIMSVPAALAISKMLVPDDESATNEQVSMDRKSFGENVIDAACSGAQQGVKIALAIGACVLCFVAFTALANQLLGLCPEIGGSALTLDRMFGYVLRPVAWMLGVPWDESSTVGSLLGKKLVFNEFLAYMEFSKITSELSPKSVVITTYALCGFSNISSVAIQIGGLGTLAPERRGEIAALGFRAVLGGTLATFMTACIAGMLI